MTEEKPICICLLGMSLKTGNLGVSALASGTITSVSSAFPNAEVFLLDYGRDPERYRVCLPSGSAEVELVNLRFSKKLYLRNHVVRLLAVAILTRLLPVKKWRQALREKNPWLKRILGADIVASLAGGDSFSDIYGLGRLLYVSLPQILTLQLGKPLVLLPQTLGPFESRPAKIIGGYILRRARAVYSRDRTSSQEAKQLLGKHAGKLKFSHDMAFAMEPVRPEASRLLNLPGRKGAAFLVGLNVSGLLLMGGYTRDNMFALKTDYNRLVREIIDCFVTELDASVLLIPHVYGSGNESDSQACARVFHELRPKYGARLKQVSEPFNQHEIKYVIGTCDFFLGARMHACIAALSQCIPTVCLAYSRKFIGVMESIGCAELVADLRSTDNAAALAAVRKVFASREKIHKSLQERIPEVRARVLNFFTSENLALNDQG